MNSIFNSIKNALLLLVLALVLVSCGPVYQTTYTYEPPSSFEGRQCVNDCLSQKSACNFRCQRNYQECTFAAQQQADFENRHHRHRHRRDRDNDFMVYPDTSQCVSDCGCGNDYNQCYENCGGIITSHSRCVAFCNKK